MAIGNVHKNLVMIGREMKFRRYADTETDGYTHCNTSLPGGGARGLAMQRSWALLW